MDTNYFFRINGTIYFLNSKQQLQQSSKQEQGFQATENITWMYA